MFLHALNVLNFKTDLFVYLSFYWQDVLVSPLSGVSIELCLELNKNQLQELVEHFSVMFSHALVDSLPGSPTDPEIQEWGARVLPHWENLRRQVRINGTPKKIVTPVVRIRICHSANTFFPVILSS